MGKIGLTRNIIGVSAFVELSPEEAGRFKVAVQNLHELVAIEQKFDILLSNFVEHEQEMASRALVQAYRASNTSEEIFDDRLHINRRVINILTAAKLYVDQIKQHVNALFPDDDGPIALLKGDLAAEREAHLSFRVVEELRHYAQHRGLPLQGLTHDSRWIDRDKAEQALEFNVRLMLNVNTLGGDRKFNKSVLAELQAIAPEIDVKPMIREYLGSLARVHLNLRTVLQGRLLSGNIVLDDAVERYRAAQPDMNTPVSLALVELKEGERRRDVLASYPHHVREYFPALQRRTSDLVNLALRFVSTRSGPSPNRQ